MIKKNLEEMQLALINTINNIWQKNIVTRNG